MLKSYPKYKDSGVSWIGMVPVGWEVKKLKSCLEKPLQYGANESGVLFDPQLPRYIRITDIVNVNTLTKDNVRSLEIEKAGRYLLKYNDILLARSGATVGKSFIYKDDLPSAFAGYLIRARINKELSPDYFIYYTQSNAYNSWKDIILIQATIQNIGANKYNNLEIPLPPRSEQDAIVAYLDDKTAKIDRLIELYKREIELLKERRQAVIHKAVTRGLDDKVKLKDSGVSWIGMVPQGWEVLPLKRFCFMKAGVNLVSTDINPNVGEYKVYGGNGLRGYYNNYNIDGDYLLVGRQGALCGNVHRVIGRIWATEHAVITRVNHKNNIGYVYYMLIAMNLNQYSNDTAAQPGLAVNVVLNLKTALPPRTEQDAIVAYLDEQCAKVDAMIGKVQSKIGLLEEYRVRLISDVVTGKVRVGPAP